MLFQNEFDNLPCRGCGQENCTHCKDFEDKVHAAEDLYLEDEVHISTHEDLIRQHDKEEHTDEFDDFDTRSN
ncbi:hypothetical protein [Comamonas aquatica]|uniref:hypothetical protein n=1 Tax=Comamonas aquatica TaxID=225991 RepID=UPI001F1B804F|nr:hypothetical protein [Comamonas aquatica]